MKPRMMASIAAGVLMVASGCGSGNGGDPAPSPTTADVSLSVKYTFVNPNPANCTGRLIWKLEPKSLTGSSGQSDPVTRDHNFNVGSSPVSGDIRSCRVSDTVGNLRSGTWQATASLAGGWVATCEVTLNNGTNLVNFTDGRVGCGTGFRFPGD